MRIFLSLALVVCGAASAQLTPIPPPPTGTPAHPFFITKTWIVGGVGDWDYLTMDPGAGQLFIAHGPTVQVVDVGTGTIVGTVKGLRTAHAVVLDAEGSFGYISDGPANLVRVFDRRSFQVVATIPTGPLPRSMALDSASGLLFVVGSQSSSGDQQAKATQAPSSRQTHARQDASTSTASGGRAVSTVTVIDTARRISLAQIALTGILGFAQGDGNGQIYITVADRNQIVKLDAQAIGSELHRMIGPQPLTRQTPLPNTQANTSPSSTKASAVAAPMKVPLVDWTASAKPTSISNAFPHSLSLDENCQRPRALALDAAHQRLFAACTNMRIVALNAETGQTVATLPIGLGADAIAYDANRGLIFTANGGNSGSLTIIRQDVTDTYSVVQILPTRQNARTLAINPSSGEVYLATVIYGAVLNSPPVTGAPLKMNAVDSSFQVLVVGN